MTVTEAPILLIQWGPEGETDEVSVIEERFIKMAPAILSPTKLHEEISKEAFREYVVRERIGYPGNALQDWKRAEEKVISTVAIPEIASIRITQSDPDRLLNALRSLLSVWGNTQVLYFSCHGTPDGNLSFDKEGHFKITFEQFADALRQLQNENVTLVLGCCYSLKEDLKNEERLPKSIREVYGFTVTPTGLDVAHLMLGILLDQSTQFEQASKRNQATFGPGVSFSDRDAVMKQIETCLREILDQMCNFDENPDRHVEGGSGVSIRMLKRVEYEDGSSWQGQSLPLR